MTNASHPTNATASLIYISQRYSIISLAFTDNPPSFFTLLSLIPILNRPLLSYDNITSGLTILRTN